tara:strand:+ start:679 stop:2100 length:1422 start_codon:yes stop_codon:yes gene_type:complete
MAFTDRLHNRGSISSGYDVSNSLKLERDNNERMNFSYPSTGSRTSQTVSIWVKRIKPGQAECIWETASADNHESRMFLRFQTDNKLRLSTATSVIRETNRVFRDTAAWYHIVVAWDTTISTGANRFKFYINGVEETSFGTSANMNQNQNTGAGIGELSLGYSHIDSSAYTRAYVAQFASLNGQYLDASSFGETNADGEWVPKDLSSLTFGDRDAWLQFESAAALGDDTSGQGHDFSVTNITSIDQATDTPTNNFCTLNNNSRTNGNIHSEHGGTYVSTDGGSGWVSMNATMGVSNGKWYWEGQRENNSDGTYVMPGIAAWNDPWIPHRSGGYYAGNVATGGSTGWYYLNGNVYNGGSGWNGPAQGDITMFALDMDNLKFYMGKNGTWQNSSNPATNTNGQGLAWSGVSGATEIVLPTVSVYQGNRTRMNFGGYFRLNQALASGNSDANGYGTFEYAPPSGFYALCSKNLAEFG